MRENWATELFGDYNPETMLIRVWMRTAVRKEITSFGTFLSTLCHEFCHHLDYQQFVASTSAPLRFTTMRGERCRSDYSGWQCRAVGGGSTGRGRIEVPEPSGEGQLFGRRFIPAPIIERQMASGRIAWRTRNKHPLTG